MNTFNSSFIKTDIGAIKVLKDLIFIGVGTDLFIYNRINRKVAQRVCISDQIITGIECYKNKILIYAENIVSLHELTENFQVSTLDRFIYNDWILAAKFINANNEIVFVSMHSEAVNLNKNFTALQSSKSTEICTCYCSLIVNENWEDLFVLSGTAFSQIFIWKPNININGKSPILYKLKGHKGVIFSIDYSKDLETICSTSDDGKAIFWPVKDIFEQNYSNEPFKCSQDITSTKEIQHRQRVFRCKFFKNVLITALEDSRIKIWNLHNFQNKTVAHQIGPIWCIDICEKQNLVFTGGADGGVISTPLKEFISCGINSDVENTRYETVKKMERYKDFVLLNDKIAIGITNKGHLNFIDTKLDCDNHKLIHVHDGLNSYGIIKKSHCGNLVCLGGMHGNIHLYRFKNGELSYEISCEIKNNPKIFSIHWLSCRSFLTCIKDGILILWYFDGENLTAIQFFQLPFTKERWSTSATYCGINNILVGDRKGNLYLFNMENRYLVQTLKKVQSMGVTKLYYNKQNRRIIVLGRNAILHKYHFDREQERLSLITKDKLPFSWLGAYYIYENKEIILGFSSDKFIIWDNTSRRNIFEISCGGGHRLWDFYIDRNNFTLVYQKIDKLTSIEFNLENEVKDVIEGFHGTETNCMKLIKVNDDPFCCISISGGEDTTVRLCHFDFGDRMNGFSTINTVKSHLSSIRTIRCHQILENNCSDCKSYFIFSAGGRAQIILWKLDVFFENKLNDVVLKEIHSYYKDLEEDESEIRIMDLTTTEVGKTIILFAACSNGKVKIYKITRDNPEIIHLYSISYKERCILKLFILKLSTFDFLVTAATDGNITFVDITEFLLDITSNVDIPVINSIKTNQSGINSYSYYHLNENKAVILTGGDDKAFTLTLIECKFSEKLEIFKLGSYSDESFHFAHITGVYITKNFFITASIDQKVIVYNWHVGENESFKVDFVSKKYTSVTDLQGIDYILNKDKLELVLFGNGFEMLTIALE